MDTNQMYSNDISYNKEIFSLQFKGWWKKPKLSHFIPGEGWALQNNPMLTSPWGQWNQ